jgi:hypothetical protein
VAGIGVPVYPLWTGTEFTRGQDVVVDDLAAYRVTSRHYKNPLVQKWTWAGIEKVWDGSVIEFYIISQIVSHRILSFLRTE